MPARPCPTERRLRGGLIALTFAAAFLGWIQPAMAHHSFAALLTEDGGDAIAIYDGTVEIYRLINPHSALIVNVVNDDGEVEDWLIELTGSAALFREGWTRETVSAGDKVAIAILRSSTPRRGRLRALLVHGSGGEDSRLLVAYGIRGNTPIMRRLQERLPLCGDIDGSRDRSQCFAADAQALQALEAEFPGKMGYVMP
jgi:hypothetical protein